MADRANSNHSAQIPGEGGETGEEIGQIRGVIMANPEKGRGEGDGFVWRFLASAQMHKLG